MTRGGRAAAMVFLMAVPGSGSCEEEAPDLLPEEGVSLDVSASAEQDALSEWREHPLNVNAASEEDLLRLPGVQRPLARRLLRERKKLRGFNSMEDLSRAPGMTEDVLEKIRPYVEVAPAADKPEFHGDVRLRLRNVNPRGSAVLSADPAFQNNTYYYNRTRFRYGRASAGWVARRASAGPALSPDNGSLLLTKHSARVEEAGLLSDALLGDYVLTYGQGILFYEGLGEFVRPVKVKARGARPDFTSGANQYLRGVFLESRPGPWGAAVFASEKPLDLRLSTSTGRVDEDLNDLREDLGDVHDARGLAENDSVRERLAGGRLDWRSPGGSLVGATAYRSVYTKTVDPREREFSNAHVFRGDESAAASFDFDVHRERWNFFGEAARSWSEGPGVVPRRGNGWTATPLFRQKPFDAWVTLFDYDPDFFARHGKGPAFAVVGAPEELTDNQNGAQYGLRYEGGRHKAQAAYTLARFPAPLGDGSGTAPIQASRGRRVYLDEEYAASQNVSLYVRYQLVEQEVFESAVSGGKDRIALRRTHRWRFQAAGRGGPRVRLRFRYEVRHEDTESTGLRRAGHLVMGDARWTPAPGLTLASRLYVFDSPAAFLTTGSEEIWDGVYYYRLAGGLNSLRGAPGTRFYFTAKHALGPDMDVWLKYDVNRRPGDLISVQSSTAGQESKAFGAARHGFHAQVDYRWRGGRPRGPAEARRKGPS
jgi:hypothetical protein